MKTTYPIYPIPIDSNSLLGKFDTYIKGATTYATTQDGKDAAALANSLAVPITEDDVFASNGDPIDNLKNASAHNAGLKTKRCPILNMDANNLPSVPGVPPLPPVPDLSFLKAFDVPAPLVALTFGAYGRGLILAAQNYAAKELQTQLIRLSQGDQCVIEIANKIQNGISSAAQVQYLIAQSVVTPVGPGVVLPI